MRVFASKYASSGQSRHALRRHVSNLVRDQLIQQNGKGKGTWYTIY